MAVQGLLVCVLVLVGLGLPRLLRALSLLTPASAPAVTAVLHFKRSAHSFVAVGFTLSLPPARPLVSRDFLLIKAEVPVEIIKLVVLYMHCLQECEEPSTFDS